MGQVKAHMPGLILLWLGALSLAGCIIWTGLFGLTIQVGLAMLASSFVAVVGFRRLDRERVKSLKYLYKVYGWLGAGALAGYFVLGIMYGLGVSPVFLQWWVFGVFLALFWVLRFLARESMKEAGMLFNLSERSQLESMFQQLDEATKQQMGGTEAVEKLLSESDESLRRHAKVPATIKCEGYDVTGGVGTVGGPSVGYMTITRPKIGRIFVEYGAELPCVIRVKAGSAKVYETQAYATWLQRKESWRRKSYRDDPFHVPRKIKLSSLVRKTLRQNLGELLTRLEVISKAHKGYLIELTTDRISVLLERYEVTREELASVCGLLLRVEAMLDRYTKGERGEVDK